MKETQSKKLQSSSISKNITLSDVNIAVNNAMASAHISKPPKPKNRGIVHKRRRPIIGVGANTDSFNVKTVPKLGYLHVYRIDPSTTTQNLCDYLKQSAPSINFTCEYLNNNSTSNSFLVSFPIHHVKEVYNPEIWPNGACVNRFLFPKESNADKNFKITASEFPLT